jgi:hypothetical protein
MTNADIAKLVGRELTPRESTTVIFEVTDRDRFDAIVRCNGTPPKIDWKTQRVWFALTRGERISNSVLAFDDGKTITLVQRPMSRAGCGGMNGGYSITTIGLQIPRDRTIELQDCPVPVNCTGLEK